MSKTAEILVQQFQKLPPQEQESILQRLLRPARRRSRSAARVPTVKLRGGRITARQVAEILDDE